MYIETLEAYIASLGQVEPLDDKFILLLTILPIISVVVYLIDLSLFAIRGKSLLGIDSNKPHFFYWVLGSTLATIILVVFGLISFKLQSLITSCLIWDVLFKKLYDSVKETELDKDKAEIKKY